VLLLCIVSFFFSFVFCVVLLPPFLDRELFVVYA
jgi:hypothetical protein